MIALLLLLLASPASADGPAPFLLTADEVVALRTDGRAYRYTREGSVDHGVSLTLVDAPAAQIWSAIADYDRYVTYLPYVTASTTLDRHTAGTHEVAVGLLELTTRGIRTRYRVEHHLYPEAAYASFTITSQGSGLLDAEGTWHLTPWQDDPSLSVLVVQVHVETAWYVPRKVKRHAAIMGLPRLASLIGERAGG